jgi:hypothetical protein
MAYLLLYVDDIVLTTSTSLLHEDIDALIVEFSMKNMCALHHFLGVSVARRNCGLFLSQR